MSVFIGVLVLVQCLFSLWSVGRWTRFVRSGIRERKKTTGPHPGPASLIVPCRGSEPGLEENLASYTRQSYPDYELIFVTSGPDDPASAVAGGIQRARLLHAAPQPAEGEKVSKLRAAVRQARAASRLLVFADSDGRPGPEWLADLLSPLARPESETGATTGYRWYVPAWRGLASLPPVVRAVWNSFIAAMMGDHRATFCWGGSMALRRETFERLHVDEYWRGSVSDDYRLTTALRDAGLRIRFLPECLVPSHGECTWRELFSWTTRQIIITRVYSPGLWKLGLGFNGFYCFGTALLVLALPSAAAAALLAAILAAGMATGAARMAGACAAIPACRAEIRRLAWAYILLSPLVPLLMFYNFTVAGFTRAISWRGTSYRLEGPQRTVVLRRGEA